jgi:hypothetical protein
MYTKESLTKLKKMNEPVPEVMEAFWVFTRRPLPRAPRTRVVSAFFL